MLAREELVGDEAERIAVRRVVGGSAGRLGRQPARRDLRLLGAADERVDQRVGAEVERVAADDQLRELERAGEQRGLLAHAGRLGERDEHRGRAAPRDRRGLRGEPRGEIGLRERAREPRSVIVDARRDEAADPALAELGEARGDGLRVVG